MTAPVVHKVSASAGRGERWVARCSCGWWQPATGADDASGRMLTHSKIVEARAALKCLCWDREAMEYAPQSCPACLLDTLIQLRGTA